MHTKEDRKKLKYLRRLLTVILILCAFAASALFFTEQAGASGQETGDYRIIYDDSAYLIDDDDESGLYEIMENISKNTNVIFYTTRTSEYGMSTADICQNYCAEYFGTSKTAPVLMFTIDMYNREIYMYCTGDIRKIIRNAEANSITDNVYKSATAGDYGKCAIDAFTQAQNCLAGGRIKRPMQIINNVLLAMLLGVTVNFIVLKVSRFNKKEDGYPPIRENGAESFISVKVNKELLKEHTSVSRESSGGGSGGGSSDFGGGSSGGGGGRSGGGHSF